jgi:protoheme IX farnesyltransferase
MDKVIDFVSLSFSSLKDYIALLKPRVITLVFFTGLTAVILASLSVKSIDILSTLIALLCIACGSGGAGVINMWYDRDIDAIMRRTQNRPIPDGRILPNDALLYALTLCISSVLLMLIFVNFISSLLLFIAIIYYGFIYTVLLKRRTVQNIVIGGAAGAFPPLIGWSAVTGDISLESIILFLIIFFWTPPHFWALALKSCDDYQLAGIPMLPVVHGHKNTKIQMIVYTIILSIISLLPYFLGFSGLVYFIVSAILNSIFIYYSFVVYKDESKCMKMFYFSVVYLFLLFTAIIVDKLILVFL